MRASIRLRHALLACLFCAPCGASADSTEVTDAQQPRFGLVLHGGAGNITRDSLNAEQEAKFRSALRAATDAGYAVLADGGTSLDAVVAALALLEDSPLFNAGVGAVYTADARHELDAAIMDGANRQAGAVTGVTKVRNPIRLARAVMAHSEHVMLSGAGAEAFADTQDLARVENTFFDTPLRRKQLDEAQRKAPEAQADADADADAGAGAGAGAGAEGDGEVGGNRSQPTHKFGTVGAVALDRHGNLAAGTSTGGMTNKRYGRIGDAPVIGAGTFADNLSCAVSATGHGEFFIRYVVAHDVCAQVRYAGMSLADAADQVINRTLVRAGGSGGIIAIDPHGNIAMPFNTPGMYRAWRLSGGDTHTGVFGAE